MSTPEQSGRNSSQSLRRALKILDLLASPESVRGLHQGMSITQLADRLQTAKSTVSRLLVPLTEQRLVQRDSNTGRFRLGDGVLWLGERYLDSLDLRAVASEHLLRLLETTGCTCHLVVRDGLDVVYIDKIEDRTAVRMASRIGSRLPMYRTAVGKAIAAWSPRELTEEIIAGGLTQITEKTITDPEKFRSEVDSVRRRGFAIDDRENEMQVRCVAAAILDHRERPIGAVSVSALAAQTSAALVREYGVQVRLTALQISAGMGSRRAVATLETLPKPAAGSEK